MESNGCEIHGSMDIRLNTRRQIDSMDDKYVPIILMDRQATRPLFSANGSHHGRTALNQFVTKGK